MQLWLPVLSDDGSLDLKIALTVTEVQLWASRRAIAATGRHAEVPSFSLLFYCGVCAMGMYSHGSKAPRERPDSSI